MIDIFIPLGGGSVADDMELRIALRSIQANASNWRRIWVVGHRPRWLRETASVKFVPLPEFAVHKESRIAMKVVWAFDNLPEMTDSIAFWNDDYVLCKATDVSTIPSYFCGDLYMRQNTRWGRSRRLTKSALTASGLPTKHYDIHVPIIYRREQMLSVRSWMDQGYVTKSVYGNHFCAESSARHSDCKLGHRWASKIESVVANRFVFSYGNGAMRRGLANWLLDQFPRPTDSEIY